MVGLLVDGRLRQSDACAQAMGAHGLDAVAAAALAETHPVATILAAWLTQFGRGRASATDELRSLVSASAGDARTTACVLLSVVALATEERLDDAIDLLRDAVAQADGASRAALLVQLACRLLEAGDAPAAFEAAEQVLAGDAGTSVLDDELRRVAARTRHRARPRNDAPPLSLEEGRDADRARAHSIGLTHLVDDVASLIFLPAGHPGSRLWNWDEGWQRLLGAWLQAELWGDGASIGQCRRLLGLYPIVASRLPYPPTWSRTEADVVDLDLLRRSGDWRLTGNVASTWWNNGPLDDLSAVLRFVATRPWAPSLEQSNLAVLAAAGDLLDTDDADLLVPRLTALVDDRAPRTYSPAYFVAPALSEVLVAAGPAGQLVALQAIVRWGNDVAVSSAMRAVLQTLALSDVSASALAAMVDVARRAIASDDAQQRQFGVDALVAAGRASLGRPSAADLLWEAWRATGSLVVAAGLLRLVGPADIRERLLPALLAAARSGAAAEGWVDPWHLLGILADDSDAAAELRAWFADEAVALARKQPVLQHLAADEQAADRVLDVDVASTLTRQLEDDAREDVLGTPSALRAAVVGALARAGLLDAEAARTWLARSLGGTRHERRQAAGVLGALARVVHPDELLTAATVLLFDRDVEVAAAAAPSVAALLDADLPRNRGGRRVEVVAAVEALARRDGSLGPLRAGQVLAAAGVLEGTLRDALASHRSARVRRALTQDLK